MTHRALSIAFILFPFIPVQAQPLPTPQEILAKVADTYRAPQRYLLTATATMRSPEFPRGSQPMPAMFAVEFPDKMRVQGALAALGLRGVNGWVMDGENAWVHDAASNQFHRFPRVSPKGSIGKFDGTKPEITRPEQFVTYFDHFLFIRYRGLVKPAGVAQVMGTEKISPTPGTEVECYVVRIDRGDFQGQKPGASRNTWWVDKNRFVVWKEDNIAWLAQGAQEETSTSYSAITINQPLPKDTFTFTPPAAAKSGQAPNQ